MNINPTPPVFIRPDSCYIWWTMQGDCESAMRSTESYVNGKSMAASKAPGGSTIPPYVLENLSRRNGRNAQGTVWGFGALVDINEILKDKWNNNDSFHRLLQRYAGGVLFRKVDAPAIFANVGFVTDIDLKLIIPKD